MENQIRGAVFKKYSSVCSFAEDIGWKRNKAARIINGIQRPSAEDMEQMAKILNIQDEISFVSIFFPGMSTK